MYVAGELRWEGVSLASLSERLDTPAFVFSERRLRRNCGDLKSALPGATLRYCAKTNNEHSLLRIVAGEGLDVLTSHLAEVELAIAAGFPPDQIAFQRPILTADEVRGVLARGVRLLHILRPSDVPVLAAAAADMGIVVDVSIRLRHRVGLPMLSVAAERLGCSEGEALSAAEAVTAVPSLRLAALNVYLGTQQRSPRAFQEAMTFLLAVARRIRARPLEINLGGGIPSPDTHRLRSGSFVARARGRDAKPGPSLREFAAALGRSWIELAAGDESLSLALEPGRCVVADAGVLLTRVVARQGRWLFVDASRNYSGETPMIFTRPVKPVTEKEGAERLFNLSGSTLNTVDVIDVRRSLPDAIGPGDVLAMFDAGAYSISRAARYAALAPAVHMLKESGELDLIRRAETYGDLVQAMVRGDE